MSINKPSAWLLLDDRPGHQAQVLGVGKALGSINEIIPITSNGFGKLPLGITTLGVSKGTREALVPPYPDVVIAAGRRTVPIARWIKKRSPSSYVVQLMWPGSAYKEYNLIAAPAHDQIQSNDARIMETFGAPHALNKSLLEASRTQWTPHFAEYPSARLGVMIGGASKHGTLSPADAKLLAATINRYGSALITTSRRTPDAFIEALQQAIKVPYYLYRYNDGGDNPYHGILACSDALLVTGDSMSMLCEAYYTGKPVEIFDAEHLCSAKHKRLHAQLRAQKSVLNEAERIAARITKDLAL